tara:strand:- start:52 stop:213 length:162 start_codon:yes stop_codon:yes gene_type:complete
MIQIYRVHCNACKSESEVHHEMDSHQYDIDFCPFCGEEVSELEVELLDEVETE